jgi:hypothetical protein
MTAKLNIKDGESPRSCSISARFCLFNGIVVANQKPRLPNELWLKIFNYFPVFRKGQEYSEWLETSKLYSKLLRVSVKWYTFFVPFLWKSINLNVNFATSNQFQMYSNCLSDLTIQFGVIKENKNYQRMLVAKLVSVCPNIERFIPNYKIVLSDDVMTNIALANSISQTLIEINVLEWRGKIGKRGTDALANYCHNIKVFSWQAVLKHMDKIQWTNIFKNSFQPLNSLMLSIWLVIDIGCLLELIWLYAPNEDSKIHDVKTSSPTLLGTKIIKPIISRKSIFIPGKISVILLSPKVHK